MTTWAEGYHDGIFFDSNAKDGLDIKSIVSFVVSYSVYNVVKSNLSNVSIPHQDAVKLQSSIISSNEIYGTARYNLVYWKGYLEAIVDSGCNTSQDILELKEKSLKNVKLLFKECVNNHIEIIKNGNPELDKQYTYWNFPTNYNSGRVNTNKANMPPSNLTSASQPSSHSQMTKKSYNTLPSPHTNFPLRNKKGRFMLGVASRIDGLKNILSVMNKITIDSLGL